MNLAFIRITLVTLIATAAVLMGATDAQAGVITYVTPGGSSTGGQPVNASAQFTTAADSIKIVLKNLQADPTSVVQNLSGLLFTLSSGQNAGTLSSSASIERAVAK